MPSTRCRRRRPAVRQQAAAQLSVAAMAAELRAQPPGVTLRRARRCWAQRPAEVHLALQDMRCDSSQSERPPKSIRSNPCDKLCGCASFMLHAQCAASYSDNPRGSDASLRDILHASSKDNVHRACLRDGWRRDRCSRRDPRLLRFCTVRAHRSLCVSCNTTCEA